jgi:hypothetical protein
MRVSLNSFLRNQVSVSHEDFSVIKGAERRGEKARMAVQHKCRLIYKLFVFIERASERRLCPPLARSCLEVGRRGRRIGLQGERRGDGALNERHVNCIFQRKCECLKPHFCCA